MNTKIVPGSILVFLIAFLSISSAVAIKVKPLSLDKITSSAEYVFEGRCIDAKTGKDEVTGMIVTWYTFEVISPVKGKLDKTFTFKQLGGDGESRSLSVPITKYEKGEHMILFLYPKSEIGLTSSVGMNQGKFSINKIEGTDVQYVSNGMNGMTLFANMPQTPPAINAKGVKTSGMEMLRTKLFEKQQFVNLIEELIEEQKIEKQ